MKFRFATVAALGAGTALALALPLAANAHVTVTPDTAEAGGYALVTFRVPNESATASTTKVTVTLPQATPFASVSYVPVAGWTVDLATEKLAAPVTTGDTTITDAVTSVTWTAHPGSELTDGQLQQFALSLGPVPDTGSVTLVAQQSYSDGTVVNWDGTGEEPAPILYVNDAPPADEHGGASHDDDAGHSNAGAASPAASASGDLVARLLGGAGLVAGAVALVLAITGRRARKA